MAGYDGRNKPRAFFSNDDDSKATMGNTSFSNKAEKMTAILLP